MVYSSLFPIGMFCSAKPECITDCPVRENSSGSRLAEPRPPRWSSIAQQNTGRAGTGISPVVHSLTVKLSRSLWTTFVPQVALAHEWIAEWIRTPYSYIHQRLESLDVRLGE
jgi:hypothetical protein